MKNFKTPGKLLLAMTLAVFAVPQVASAASDINAVTKSVHVKVTDLNLANQAGVDALYHRLSGASRRVCGNTSDLKLVGSLKQLRLNKVCYDSTMAQALAEVNFPSLAQVSYR